MLKYCLSLMIPFLFFAGFSAQAQSPTDNAMIVRIAEIEVFPQYLDEYKKIAKEIAEASVQKEQGVIAIMPMQVTKEPTQFRIIEIYKGSDQYKSHLATDHFKKYKTLAEPMVKSLKLVDTMPLSYDLIPVVFSKAKK